MQHSTAGGNTWDTASCWCKTLSVHGQRAAAISIWGDGLHIRRALARLLILVGTWELALFSEVLAEQL